ncbi:MAG TPA: methyl-accepting chemotaxis protein [Leptolyngbyaceae cyanobacterium]
MLKKWKLGKQLFLGYSVPIFLFVSLAWIVYGSANQLSGVFRQVALSQKIVESANNMSLSSSRLVVAARGYLLSKNPLYLNQYQNELIMFEQAAKNAGELVDNPNQRQRLAEMVSFQRSYQQYTDKLIGLLRSGKTDQALANFRSGQGQAFVENFKQKSIEFNTNEKEILNKATDEAKNLLSYLIAAVAIGAFLCLGFSLLAAYWISSGITKTINQATSAIATSSTEIATTVEEQERTASQQAASVNQTTTTMDELGASSQQAASQAEAALSAAQQALALAASGTEAVQENLAGMSGLKERVGAIALEISHLSEQTNQIANISSLVSDLANQTNMLALNAAVEAVRAGEDGKGFGVVAAEIRKLADRSKRSAEKISFLVADIQTAIDSTVTVTERGTKTVELNVKIAGKTAEAFSGVTEAINKVLLNNQQISLSAKQQAIAIQQVVDAMNSLNHAAAQTASGIGQTRIGTQKLNDAAQSLKQVI